MKKEKKESARQNKPPQRGNGILLHISSLPSGLGIGDFGPGAYQFIDFLADSKQSLWQILPLNPTATVLGNSPYSSVSAFAGNVLFISPEFLVRDGFLSYSELENRPTFPVNRVDYEAVTAYRLRILLRVFEQNQPKLDNNADYQKFCRDNADWLDDYCLFVALKEHFNGVVWSEWPKEARDRDEKTIKDWNSKLFARITREKFYQFLFFRQWVPLKQYANQKKIKIVGDIPIYVSFDSADVWANPQFFKLDKDKRPLFLAGVPPDYFSTTGQLWGNPVYKWDALKKDGYKWWIHRFSHNLKLFDIIRLDHFRGFVSYWEVPAGEKTAVKGEWVKVPAEHFFTALLDELPGIPILAEDLGIITDEVREIMKEFGFPGMKLLLFAFDETPAKNPYMPHNHIKNCFVYTGTHDNNTVRGWFEKDARSEDRNRVYRYFGREIPYNEIAWEFSKLAMMSVADTVILPLQDILGLGHDARMNHPSTGSGNWEWRVSPEMLSPWITSRLREITEIYGRA